jgi:hypothetical protein
MPASTACSSAVELNWTDRLFTGTARTKLQEPTLGKPEVHVLLSQFPLADALLRRRFDEGTSSLTCAIESMLASVESAGVRIPMRDEVYFYLIRHHDLTDLVPVVVGAAWDRFGDRAQLSLEVYRDPEIEDEYLTLYVRQQRYDPEIMDRIKEAWLDYQDKLVGKSGWLLLTTDFCPPT